MRVRALTPTWEGEMSSNFSQQWICTVEKVVIWDHPNAGGPAGVGAVARADLERLWFGQVSGEND